MVSQLLLNFQCVKTYICLEKDLFCKADDRSRSDIFCIFLIFLRIDFCSSLDTSLIKCLEIQGYVKRSSSQLSSFFKRAGLGWKRDHYDKTYYTFINLQIHNTTHR